MNITLTEEGDNLTVESPYHAKFIEDARDMGAKWDCDGKTWKFDARLRGEVLALLERVFGWVEDAPIVDIRITAKQDLEGNRAAVYAGPVEIARARGRDGGATFCDGAAKISGTATSGGSAKNWKTIVRAGTLIQVHDVPEGAVAKINERDWDVEVIRKDKHPATVTLTFDDAQAIAAVLRGSGNPLPDAAVRLLDIVATTQ